MEEEDERQAKGAASLEGMAEAFHCVGHKKLWKLLKEMGIPDHLTCLLRNQHAGQVAIVRTRHGKTDWLKIGKGAQQGYILSPCLFIYLIYLFIYPAYLTSVQSTSHEMQGWMNQKLESRFPGEISTTSDMQMIPFSWKKVKRN